MLDYKRERKLLSQKLGIKGGIKVITVNPPDNYYELLGDLPENVVIIHVFEIAVFCSGGAVASL